MMLELNPTLSLPINRPVDVLKYLASGMTEQEILADFPELEPEDIKACLAFAADRERKFELAQPSETSH